MGWGVRDAAAFTSKGWTFRPIGNAESTNWGCTGTHWDLLSQRSGTCQSSKLENIVTNGNQLEQVTSINADAVNSRAS